MRLQLKAVITFATLLLATTLILSLASAHRMRGALREEVGQRMQTLAEHLARDAEYALFVSDRAVLLELAQQAGGEPDVVGVRIEDVRGSVLVSLRPPDPRSADGHALSEGVMEFCATTRLGAAVPGLVRRIEPRDRAGRVLGKVCVAAGLGRADRAAARANRTMAGLTLPVAAAGLVLTFLLARRIARPLGALTRGLEGVAEGRPVGELPERGKDEIAILGRAFNRMLRDVGRYREEAELVNANLETMIGRRTRELEQTNRELAAASRTKSEFLANMSHELRTPLNAVLGFLSLVIDGLCQDAREEKELLRDAQQGATHLLSIINSILDLAKIETGKMSLHLEKVEVLHVYDEVRALLRAQAELKGIRLEFECEGARPLAVLGDAGKLKQVLVNLVGNALKFTDKGRVLVRARARADKGHVRFEVSDTGIGIAPDKHHLLFKNFQQVDASSTRRHGGTGLGLAICRALVEMMGGSIWLHSAGEEKGTTVSFTVPIYRDAEQLLPLAQSLSTAATPQERGTPAPAAAGLCALVVEDDPACRLVLREIFTLCGYRVVEASGADEALEKARQARPHLVTVDLGLPADQDASLSDGCDLIRALQRDPHTRSAQVVLISGQEPAVIRERLQREGLPGDVRLFAKPVNTRQMMDWAEALRDQAKSPAAAALLERRPAGPGDGEPGSGSATPGGSEG